MSDFGLNSNLKYLRQYIYHSSSVFCLDSGIASILDLTQLQSLTLEHFIIQQQGGVIQMITTTQLHQYQVLKLKNKIIIHLLLTILAKKLELKLGPSRLSFDDPLFFFMSKLQFSGPFSKKKLSPISNLAPFETPSKFRAQSRHGPITNYLQGPENTTPQPVFAVLLKPLIITRRVVTKINTIQ